MAREQTFPRGSFSIDTLLPIYMMFKKTSASWPQRAQPKCLNSQLCGHLRYLIVPHLCLIWCKWTQHCSAADLEVDDSSSDLNEGNLLSVSLPCLNAAHWLGWFQEFLSEQNQSGPNLMFVQKNDQNEIQKNGQLSEKWIPFIELL